MSHSIHGVRYSKDAKEDVRKLRARGKTYAEIKAALRSHIAKSTISLWCRGTALPKWYPRKIEKLSRLNNQKAQRASKLYYKEQRILLLQELENNNIGLESLLGKIEVLKLALAILYLGEGAKWKSHRGLMLGSSDPNIVLLYVRLLRACYGIQSHQLKARVCYRADQNLSKLQRYWSSITSIPIKSFYKSKPDQRTVGKKTKRLDYKGVCVIMCAGTKAQIEFEVIAKMILKYLT